MYCIEKKPNLEKFSDSYRILKEAYRFTPNILGILVHAAQEQFIDLFIPCLPLYPMDIPH